MSKLKNSITDIEQRIEVIKNDLRNKIQSLPDNSKISRLKSGAFTISSKDIFASKGTVLSPSYYDFKLQYKYLSEVIDNTNINNLFTTLDFIIVSGTHKIGSNTMKFNPEVIAYLKEIIA